MKNHFLGCLIVGFAFLIACGDGNIQVTPDPTIQLNEDRMVIEEFIASEGYTEDQVDTTELGVRFIILDSGFVDSVEVKIDESDIVDYDFIGRLTNDSLFDTSIASIAEGTRVFDSLRTYQPLITVFTSTGWYINSAQSGLVTGFRDGITNTFGSLAVGGSALIIIPSGLAFGTFPISSNGVETIPANSVVTFELRPVRVRKQ